MAAAQTNGHEEDKHTEMQLKKIRKERKKKRKMKSRKQGTKASKQENRTQGVGIATNLPVSATKPRRGPCHTICHLPAFVGNRIKCYCYRCRAPPPANESTKTQTKLPGLGGCGNSSSLICRTGTLPHDLPFRFRIRRQQYQYCLLYTSPSPRD